MKLICDKITEILEAENTTTPLDQAVCMMFEAESARFEELVKLGFANKRGYQLMGTDNPISNNIQFNKI